MEHFHISPAEAEAAVRAMKAVALADGDLEDHEHNLIAAAGGALGVGRDVGGFSPIEPTAVAAAVVNPMARKRLVQALEVMCIMDGSVSEREIEAVRQFAAALEVDEPRIANLEQIMAGHLRRLQLDLLRRSPMTTMLRETWKKRGLTAAWKYLGSLKGVSHDPQVAWRFKQLGLLPDGTVGRSYWAHMTQRRFPFPGEHLGLPEEMVRHDLSHLLSGYGTNNIGEMLNATFIAGFLKQDAFAYFFMAAVHTQLDIEVFPDDPHSMGFLTVQPAALMEALERGLQVNQDLYSLDWDYWEVMDLPVDEARRQLNIVPLREDL